MFLASLVGEQPAPNLLPARRLAPQVTALVYTDHTRYVAENLRAVLSDECTCLLWRVPAYHIEEIHDLLSHNVDRHTNYDSVIFNLTGGTKPMALAGFQLARDLASEFIYFQTEGNVSRTYRYGFTDGSVRLQSIDEAPETISLDDYLRIYLGDYEVGGPRSDFEMEVLEALSSAPEIDEVFMSLRPQRMSALEVDFAVRCGNQVGVGEIKQKGAKAGIDQVKAATGRGYIGTYVHHFLVSAHSVDRNNLELAEQYHTVVIELPSFLDGSRLDASDQRRLAETVASRLGVQL